MRAERAAIRKDALDYLAAHLQKKSDGEVSLEKTAQLLDERCSDCFFVTVRDENEVTGAMIAEEESFHVRYLASDTEAGASAMLEYLKEEAQRMNFARLTASGDACRHELLEQAGFIRMPEENNFECFLQNGMLKKTVTVIVDRPYGSLHPHIPDLECPYNFGYVRGSMQDDGEFQDAYVIGPAQPVDEFTGIVSGIVYRKGLNRSRWIVTAAPASLSRENIVQLIGPEEQYYETKIEWAN